VLPVDAVVTSREEELEGADLRWQRGAGTRRDAGGRRLKESANFEMAAFTRNAFVLNRLRGVCGGGQTISRNA